MNIVPAVTIPSNRNYGIDFLRLMAAFYVMLLHTLYQGGVHSAVTPYSYQHYVSSMLLIIGFCGVNIFGIISGYVGYRHTFKPASLSGFLSLWLSVVVYGVGFCAFFMFAFPGSASWKDLVSMFFPLSKNLYWYFSCYSLVYFLSPYLNQFVASASNASLKKCFFLICCVVVPLEYLKETFTMAGGYSAMWLLLLYLLGAIMKKTELFSKVSSLFAVAGIIVVDLCYFYLNIKLLDTEVFVFYLYFELNRTIISPFYLLPAIAHVIVFSRLRFPVFIRKMIAFAAPATFFVYIANVQDLFWKYYMKDRFTSWASGSPVSIFVRTVGFSFAFVLAVVFLDYFRRKLFDAINIKKNLRRIDCYFQKDPAD